MPWMAVRWSVVRSAAQPVRQSAATWAAGTARSSARQSAARPVQRSAAARAHLDNIDSIKVIKGGASYLFGEDALSGAVIITTKRGAKMAGVTASFEKGSFNYNKSLARVGFSQGDWVGH